MKTIKCTKCKLDKNISEFYVSKRHELGYIPTCKNCESLRHHKKYDSEKRKKHYIKNKETYLLRSKAYNVKNRDAIKKKNKEYYNNNKLKFLESSWKSKGIINKDSKPFKKTDFDELFLKAGNCCEICKTTIPKHLKGFVVDHCHVTGFARGILCALCNTALGGFRDDLQIIKAAIDYLQPYDEQ